MYARFAKLALAMLALAVGLCASDAFWGTWKLSLERSKYDPGPAPLKSLTIKYESEGEGVKASFEGVSAAGDPVSGGYTAKFDGKDSAVTGAPWDTISLKKAGDYTWTATTKKDGKVFSTSKSVISKDGQTLTTTSTGTNDKGEKFRNVSVYEKQ